MDEKELKRQLDELRTQLKTYFDKAAEETKARGTMLEETKTAIANLQRQVDAIDMKLAEKLSTGPVEKTFLDELKENTSVQRLMHDHRGSAVISLQGKQFWNWMERKTTITSQAGSTGVATTGVLQIDRIPGIVPEARQILKVRNVLPARPTTMQVVDFVKVTTPMVKASPQQEANTKLENAVVFSSVSERVRTLATWIPASRQVLDDFAELANFIDGSLRYYVDLDEETELLSGDNTGEHLNGLITQATSFNTGLLSATAGWNKIDIVGRAAQQIMVAKETTPTFLVLHPTDWWDMRLTKDSYGRYILGDPNTPLVQTALFDLTPVVTTSITSGTFLVGSGNPAAVEIRDRMEMQVEISTEHSDYFIKNLVAIRAEKRLALVVKRPASFITGTFTTSP